MKKINIISQRTHLVQSALIALTFLLCGGIFSPHIAQANTNSTVYIPASGLGYYVDSQGNPITSQSALQYTCQNSVCTQVSTGQSPIATTGNALPSTGYSSGSYFRYTTPPAAPFTSFGALPVFPSFSYVTPQSVVASDAVTLDSYVSLPYFTYGSTPAYSRIPVQSYRTVPVGGQTNGFQLTSPSTGVTSGRGGFTMTYASF